MMKFEKFKAKVNDEIPYTLSELTSEYFHSLPIMSVRVVSNYVDVQKVDDELLKLHKMLRWYLLFFPDKKNKTEMIKLEELLHRYFTVIFETEREQYYALTEISCFLTLFWRDNDVK